ncbi:MAG: DUF3885 domain-containing protein [Gemmatimonadota bacterium]|jgi:hypothetical protein|nr:DUF3885 domain-containing protein [Gemmatimonadota bacterium]
MPLRSEIERVFEGNAFKRPLFYSYPGGLRFELSVGDTAIDQFLLAIKKAGQVCADIFSVEQPFIACLRMRCLPSISAHRKVLRELAAAGIRIPRNRNAWLELVPSGERFEETIEEFWVNIAFEVEVSAIQPLLWCALAKDFSSIRPRPACDIYLFELKKGVMIFPYDDRGMDVVGPNHTLLAELYGRYYHYLLDYDRLSMEATFGAL